VVATKKIYFISYLTARSGKGPLKTSSSKWVTGASSPPVLKAGGRGKREGQKNTTTILGRNSRVSLIHVYVRPAPEGEGRIPKVSAPLVVSENRCQPEELGGKRPPSTFYFIQKPVTEEALRRAPAGRPPVDKLPNREEEHEQEKRIREGKRGAS